MTAVQILLACVFGPIILSAAVVALWPLADLLRYRPQHRGTYQPGPWYPRTPQGWEDTMPEPLPEDVEKALAAMWASVEALGIERPA